MRAQGKANLVTMQSHRLVPSRHLCVFGVREHVENMSPRAPQPNPNPLSPPKHLNSDLVRVWQSQAGN